MKRAIGVIIILFSVLISTNTIAAVIFRDNFEYLVGRDDPNAASLFINQGRWGYVKTYQSNEPGALGWLYTTNSIPGYQGSFPGTASTRVLAIEARPATLRPGGGVTSQTDVYLQLGGTDGPEVIPANAWIQYWIYSNYYGEQLSTYSPRNKFIYPCPGDYPCTNGQWLWMAGGNGCNDPPISGGPFPDQVICLEADTANRSNASDPSFKWRLGQNINSMKIRANTWTLVKLHIDTSTSQGKYEAWLRTVSGGWIKVTEYLGGVTPNFTWPITPGGQRKFRMPTVINYYDSWQYMDDFVIAESETDLPVYGATLLKIPAPVQIMNITPSN